MKGNTLTYDEVTKLMHYELTHPFDIKTMDLIFHVYKSIYRSVNFISNIDTDHPILSYRGMSGKQTRHLYNNLLSFETYPINYLEIGTWYGSSSISALYKNDIRATFIDNWSQFGGNKDILIKALEEYKTKDTKYTLVEGDCWSIDVKDLPNKYDVYLYDGPHEESDHYNALVHYLDALSDTFIFIVDDWNWWNVRSGTIRAFNDTNVEICFVHEFFMSQEDLIDFPNHKGINTWWNGVGIFVLKKKKL